MSNAIQSAVTALQTAMANTDAQLVNLKANALSNSNTLAQLRKLASELVIKGRSKMNKAALAQAIAQTQIAAQRAAKAAQPVMAEAVTTAGYIAKDAAVLAWDAATSDEAKVLYVRTAKAIAHSAAFLVTLLLWGLVELWQWLTIEAPALVQDVRTTIRTAVAQTQPQPLALPWSADCLEAWSTELDIVWPSHTDRLLVDAGLLPA